MEYKININGDDFRIKKLYELSISDYNKIYKVIEGNDYFSLLYMLTDIPAKYMNYIPEDAIKKIDWNVILNEEFKAKEIKKQYIGKNLLELDKIKVGRYIELDYMLTHKEDDKMEYVLAYMIREGDEDISNLVDEIKKKLKLVDVIAPINYFVNWRKEKIKEYQSLFQSPDEDDDDEDFEAGDDYEFEEDGDIEEGTDYGWVGIVYDSAGPELGTIHDVFGMGMIEFLNYLSWKKQKIQREIEEQNKSQKRIH